MSTKLPRLEDRRPATRLDPPAAVTPTEEGEEEEEEEDEAKRRWRSRDPQQVRRRNVTTRFKESASLMYVFLNMITLTTR